MENSSPNNMALAPSASGDLSGGQDGSLLTKGSSPLKMSGAAKLWRRSKVLVSVATGFQHAAVARRQLRYNILRAPSDTRTEHDLMVLDGVFQRCATFSPLTKNARFALGKKAQHVAFEAGKCWAYA